MFSKAWISVLITPGKVSATILHLDVTGLSGVESRKRPGKHLLSSPRLGSLLKLV